MHIVSPFLHFYGDVGSLSFVMVFTVITLLVSFMFFFSNKEVASCIVLEARTLTYD